MSSAIEASRTDAASGAIKHSRPAREPDMDALFQPGRIGSLVLKNRIVKSPQSTALSNMDGTVTQRSVNHYKRLAEGGTGLVMTEYTYIDDDAAKAIHCQLGNTRREHVPGMGWLVDEVHAAGAKIGMQLAHGGRQKFLGTAPVKAASDVSWDYVEAQYGVKPVPMTVAELEQVMADFGDAALRAVQARFDLVEVHAGHGYLITNFLSPHTNKRSDEYGGSFENRIRLLIGIVPCMRCNDGCLHRGLNVGRSAGCTVNPSMGEEYRYPIEASPRAERVAVVGGGPAGMNAARVLAERGHQVVLFEEAGLGGQLNTAVRHQLKFDLRALRDHLVHRLDRPGIKIIHGGATASRLAEGGFDRVLLATGRRPAGFAGAVSGGKPVLAKDIADPHALEGPIAIIGAGMTGCDTAVWLQRARKRELILIEAADRILPGQYVFTDQMGMPALLAEHEIDVRTSHQALEIKAEGVRVRDETGSEAWIPARTVVIACGYVARIELLEALAKLAPSLPVDLLGTARQDGRVMDALHDAFFTARRC